MNTLARYGTVILLSVVISCGGGGGGGGNTGNTNDNNTDNDNTTAQPAFNGFGFTLATGDFWEYRWDYYDNSWAQGSSPATVLDAGRFWVVLGQTSRIQGLTAYEVLIYGRSKKRESFGTRSFGPRWKFVALSDNKIYGSTDGTTLTTFFDAGTGKWPGGGFFTTIPASTLNIAQNGTISSYNTFISGTAVVSERSSSQSECEYYPGIGSICGDSSYTYSEKEYYRAAIGPVGYYYYNSFSDCGGGFCSGATWRHNAGLTASSFTGQANPLVTESEPNDSPATAQAITTGHPIIGSVTQSTLANMGNTVITVTVVDDNGHSATFSPPVEDWYAFSLASVATVTITLSFEGDSTADLDMFLMNAAATTLLGYSVHDNPARNDQNERIVKTNLQAGSYRIGVDGCYSPSGPVKYTLQIE